MSHPLELLAPYVDGTLSSADRDAVGAHLRDCATCRREVAVARSARAALRALPEVAPPAGVASRVLSKTAIDEPGNTTAGANLAAERWRRLVAVAAVAAAVGLGLLIVPRIGNVSEDAATGGVNQEEAGVTERAAARLERSLTDLDAAALEGLAVTTAGGATSAGDAEAVGAATPAETGFEVGGTVNARPQVRDAARCFARVAPEGGTLVRGLIGTFDGTPAYVGVWEVGPGAGQPADLVQVWAVARDGCRILSFASARIA
jgi:hypothetical protein